MTTDDFVHLHNHSDMGSALDGMGSPKGYVERAAELGQRAIALTDHGTMVGSLKLQREADSADIQAIWGIEAYMAPTIEGDKATRHLRKGVSYAGGSDSVEGGNDVSAGGKYTHATLLARTTEGIHNLMKLNSTSWNEGVYGKPRGDIELMERHNQGLIYLTGCPSSEINTRLRIGDVEGAEKHLDWAIQNFGKENVFLEVMDHSFPKGLEIERASVPGLMYLHERFNIPYVATNDCHYVHPKNAHSHDQMLCLSTGSFMSSMRQGDYELRVNAGEVFAKKPATRFAFDGEGYWLRSRAEMEQALGGQFEGALDNTLLIAEICQGARLDNVPNQLLWVDMTPHMPEAYGRDKYAWLLDTAINGLKEIEKQSGRKFTQQDVEQLKYELNVIHSKGYSDYFAFFWDFAHAMRTQHKVLMNPGRGSAAGCLLSYGLGITLLDPMRYGLIFERFLNPERESPPDIDFDIPDSIRDQAIQYVKDKYGEDSAMLVTTISRLKVKQSLKDVLRVNEVDYQTSERLTKLIDDSAKTFDEAGQDFWDAARESKLEKHVEQAKDLLGVGRGYGVHASALIVSSLPIDDYCPTMVSKKGSVTQWEYPLLEELGFVKFDFLGLANLTTIQRCIDLIRKNHGVTVNMEQILQGDLDDAKTYKLLCEGKTAGVFQVEGDGITETLVLMRPKSIHDIAAVCALYRPGPMETNSHILYGKAKNGELVPELPHADFYGTKVEELLSQTYNLLVYQEQVMQIANQGCGFTLAEADHLRAAMGKKKIEVMNSMKGKFIEGGMRGMGVGREAMEHLWDTIVPFAKYAFNKSHAYSYGLLTYATAYLKANYAPEFMSALIYTAVAGESKKPEKVTSALNECRLMGIPVKQPSITAPDTYPTSDGTSVYMGLSAVKGLGARASKAIIGSAPFASIDDFAKRVGVWARENSWSEKGKFLSPFTSKDMYALIGSGFFDALGKNRRTMDAIADEVIVRIKEIGKSQGDTLFGAFEDTVEPIVDVTLAEYPKMTILQREMDTISMYASGHPLDNVRDLIEATTTATARTMSDFAWSSVKMGGRVVEKRSGLSKKDNSPWSNVTVEDVEGNTFTVFGYRESTEHTSRVQFGDCVVFSGTVRTNKDSGESTLSPTGCHIIPLDDDGRAIVTISVAKSRLDGLAIEDVLKTEDAGLSQMSLRIEVLDVDNMREQGQQVSLADRTPETWETLIEQNTTIRHITSKNTLAPRIAISMWGESSTLSWQNRLVDSYERWKVQH